MYIRVSRGFSIYLVVWRSALFRFFGGLAALQSLFQGCEYHYGAFRVVMLVGTARGSQVGSKEPSHYSVPGSFHYMSTVIISSFIVIRLFITSLTSVLYANQNYV